MCQSKKILAAVEGNLHWRHLASKPGFLGYTRRFPKAPALAKGGDQS